MKIKNYFTTIHIIEGLIIAITLSGFIYIEYFKLLEGYYLIAANSILALLGLFLLLRSITPVWFFSGFFIGIFWLYWLGISFYYYKMAYLAPIVIFLIGLIYGSIFLFAGYASSYFAQKLEDIYGVFDYTQTVYFFRAIAIFLLSFLTIFSFDWLKLPLIFTDSAFGLKLWQFGLILLSLASFLSFKKWYLLLIILLAVDLKNPKELSAKSLRDIELVNTNVSVLEKWQTKNQQKYTDMALAKVDKAISEGKEMVVLPESVLPYFLNLATPTLNAFLERSKKITIIVGSLYFISQGNYKNSAYIIKDGNWSVANKVVLVPFGEANPLPKWMGKIVNKIFFDGSVDYGADKNFTYINALGKRYKIAICYEGTNKKTYQDYPKFLILISNNGWFKPSIEPTLQEILIKYYSKLYKTTVYHSINGSKAYVIVPHPEED